MSEQLDKHFIEQDRAGDERSLYGDMIRSRDFGEQSQWSNDQLHELGGYWKGELHSPERSPRAKKEIDLLLGRTVFELVMRQVDETKLSKQQFEEEQCWDLLDNENA